MAKSEKNVPNVTIRDAQIQYVNFEGRATRFKDAGTRSFRLILPEELGQEMLDDGWNVNYTKPWREATDEEIANFEPRPYVEVFLGYKYEKKAPKVRLITSTMQRMLVEDTVFLVDQSEIIRIDLTINPSHWDLGGKQGIKAYLLEAFITIQESELEKEYNHIPLEGAVALADPPKYNDATQFD